eukprot:m.132199 g.132199  ORF g.132199 m.132199 type:complete len:166 (+) comp20054_c0_seq1:594-1091(+)
MDLSTPEEQAKQQVRSSLAEAASSAAKERPLSQAEEKQPEGVCAECGDELDGRRVHHKIGTKHYHQNCMTCSFCHDGLAGQKFALVDDRLCCKGCQGKAVGRLCKGCGKVLSLDVKVKNVAGRVFHPECLRCFTCSKLLGDRDAFPEGEHVYCRVCGVAEMMKKA